MWNLFVAMLFTIGAGAWAEAGNPWIAALWGLVAGLWWAATIEEIVYG